MFVLDVTNELVKRKIKFALVGGYALAMHGIVRATMDVDIVVGLTKRELIEAEAAMAALGLTSRTSEMSTFASEIWLRGHSSTSKIRHVRLIC